MMVEAGIAGFAARIHVIGENTEMPIVAAPSQRRPALRRPAAAMLPLLLAAALGLGSSVHAAELKSSHHFEIPPQSLATALNALAKQSGVQIMSSGVDLIGLQVPGVVGDYTLQRALEALLADTGLEYAVSGDNTIVVRSRTPQRRVPADPQASRAATESGVRTLDGVIVTAEKRMESASSVPMGISVITEETLERTQVNSVSQLAGLIPGFSVASTGAIGRASLSIRGIAPMGNTASMAVYIDDVPLTANVSYAGPSLYIFDLLPYDLQNMEVLRGPQGTLYGASALGGILKYTTRKPEPGFFEGRVGAGFEQVRGGGGLGWAVRGSLNAPLIEDRVALRLSYARKEVPGWINAVRWDGENTNESSQQVIRASLLWKLTDSASLLLSASRQTGRQEDTSQIFLDTATWEPFAPEYGHRYRLASKTDIGSDLYSATFDLDLGWADLISSTSYMDASQNTSADSTYLYGDFLPLVGLESGLVSGATDPYYDKLVQEVRLTSKSSDRFEWLVGGFYTDEDTNLRQLFLALDENGAPQEAATQAFADARVANRYRETALFANAAFKFTQKLDVSAGIRYAKNKQDLDTGLSGYLVGGSANETGRSEEGVTTYSLAPRYFFDDDTMVYARYSTGYRAGGPNAIFPGIPQTQVNSDTLANYEVGLKRYFMERRAYVDVQAFHIDWDDLRVNLLHEGISYGSNGGGARSRGIELESRFLLAGGWNIGFSGAYIDASLRDPIPGQAAAGDPLPMTPDVTAAFTTQYSFQLGDWAAYVGGSYRHYGSVVTSVAPAEAFKLPSYRMLDLNAGLNRGNWSIALYVRNVANELAYANAQPISSALAPADKLFIAAVPAQPRTVGIAFDYRF